MRVLVTRPEPGASRTATRLVAMGMEPVIRPIARPSVNVSGVEWALSRGWGAAAITSANAVRALASMQGAVSHFTSKPVFAVGNATADAARKAGFRDVRVGQGNGDHLGMFITREVDTESVTVDEHNPLIYLAAKQRSPGLERGLASARLPYGVAIVYEMIPISYSTDFLKSAVHATFCDAALFFSREAVLQFFAGLKEHKLNDSLNHTRIFCISEHVARALPDSLRDLAIVASRPNEDGLLDKLSEYRDGKIGR